MCMPTFHINAEIDEELTGSGMRLDTLENLGQEHAAMLLGLIHGGVKSDVPNVSAFSEWVLNLFKCAYPELEDGSGSIN